MPFTTLVPALTPFDADLNVDVAALKRGVDYVVERCRAGMVIAAGVEAQEYQYLSFSARKDLIVATIDAVDRRSPVVVGVSHPSFRIAIELAHHAEKHGASVIQLLAPLKPTGGAPTTAELVRYYEAVARETSLPLMLYLNAGPGADLSIPATIELAKLDRIKFVKESSRDVTRVARLLTEIEHAGHAQYFATMQLLLTLLQLGGSGITLPPPAAEIARLAIDAYEGGDLAAAIALQQQFALFPAKWMAYGLAAVMKAASHHVGVPLGDPYPPYAPVQGAELDALRAYLATTALQPS